MKKFFRRLLKFVLFILIVAIAFVVYHKIKYFRLEKSHPKYIMTIQGTIDPKIANQFRFFMDYASSKKTCDEVNYIAGLRGVRIKSFDFPVPVDASGHFTLKIPLDRYYSGFCGWVPRVFGISHEGFEYGFLMFEPGHAVLNKEVVIKCNKKDGPYKMCRANNEDMEAYRDGYTFLQPAYKSYVINLSIRK